MKKIFYLRTYYQIIFALQMVNTICKDDEVVFLISDDSNGSKRVAEKIQSIGIVKKVIWIKTKRLTYEKNLFEKISDSISIALLETNRYENVLRPILNIGFDEFIFFNFGVTWLILVVQGIIESNFMNYYLEIVCVAVIIIINKNSVWQVLNLVKNIYKNIKRKRKNDENSSFNSN